ncbi:transcriptional regulator [Mesorhizobium sp. LHD-90]|uniref:transcriptional regulator n=1 Tax=Mesorhizobium sp. LHD-90 TaxID=3071414 RepID=UPI0027E16232|nr:transcriptional regulator [Mesorhizobium sp. LHD-90]MDQ6436686.1 transcriptional regulator [Mesorhizobium sp. LHD-90]
MTSKLEIAPELRARVDAIAARSNLTAAEVIADALEHGHSLDWQEQFLDKVAEGIAAADRGEFAKRADIERVRNKYRPS